MRLFLFCCLLSTVVCDNLTVVCGSAEAQLSCGTCIKQNPGCAWCRDPHALTTQRCQPKTAFTKDTCNPDYVYAPVTEMKIAPHNLRLEALQGDGKTVVQLEPQQVVLRMKPGDKLTVPFKYLHKKPVNGYDVRDFYIQTSEFHTAKGVDLKFLVNCDGVEVEGKQCPGVREGEQYDFKIEVTLQRCSNEGDVSISVGVYGYNTVSALYVTPLCGCECEKLQQQEKNSPLCHNHGNMICGQCVCENTRGGDRCDCPLANYGVKNAMELEDKCRANSSAQICSGNGLCKCGHCECNTHTLTGKFCECDHAVCPTGPQNSQSCSGNGICQCGKCQCEDGWEREDCSCSSDKKTCQENGVECNNNGHCECGRCVCDTGFTGAFCGAQDAMTVSEVKHDRKEKPVKNNEENKSDEVDESLPAEPIKDNTDDDDDVDAEAAEGQKQSSFSAQQSIIGSILVFIMSRFM